MTEGSDRLARLNAVLDEWGVFPVVMDEDGDIEAGEVFAEAIQDSGAWRFVRDVRKALR